MEFKEELYLNLINFSNNLKKKKIMKKNQLNLDDSSESDDDINYMEVRK